MSSVTLRRPIPGIRALTVAACAVAALAPAPVAAQAPLTLADAVAIAQRQGNPARAAAEARTAARQRDRAFGASLLPQLSISGNLPTFNRSIIPVLQPDGTTLFKAQAQSDASLNMSLTQRLPLTGGDLFINSSLARIQVAGERDTRTWQSTPFSVGVRQELNRPNDLKWDTREQELRLDAAEREYLEQREEVALATANAFFDYYAARMALRNAEANAGVNDTLFTLNKGRYEVGRIGENDLLQSELALLRARTSLDGARLEFDRTRAALRLQLALPHDAPLDIVVPLDVPVTSADTAVAVAQALRNRAQVSQLELQDVQASRRETEARLNNGFGATVQASVGFNQTGTAVGDVYNDLLNAQRVQVAVQMPLMQWGSRSAQVEAARADRDRTRALARQTREQTAQDAHFTALQLAQSARQLALSAKADTVAAKRFEVAYNRYVIGRIGIDNLYLAQNEKDQALLQYVQALRGYWTTYYRLRRTTLYDFATGQAIR